MCNMLHVNLLAKGDIMMIPNNLNCNGALNTNPMKEAIRQAELGIARGHGGPFGAVVVKDGKIIARGHNRELFDRYAKMEKEMY